MYFKAEGLKNKLGLAMALTSNPKNPKIRIEDHGWMEGLTNSFSVTQGKNYRIDTMDRDELVLECKKLLGKKDCVLLKRNKAQEFVQRVKQMVLKSMPTDFPDASLKINREHPVDFYEINMKTDSFKDTSIIIPISIEESKIAAKIDKVPLKTKNELIKHGFKDEDIVSLVEDLNKNGIKSEKELSGITKSLIE